MSLFAADGGQNKSVWLRPGAPASRLLRPRANRQENTLKHLNEVFSQKYKESVIRAEIRKYETESLRRGMQHLCIRIYVSSSVKMQVKNV